MAAKAMKRMKAVKPRHTTRTMKTMKLLKAKKTPSARTTAVTKTKGGVKFPLKIPQHVMRRYQSTLGQICGVSRMIRMQLKKESCDVDEIADLKDIIGGLVQGVCYQYTRDSDQELERVVEELEDRRSGLIRSTRRSTSGRG